MACPYFDPLEPWDSEISRVTLGQAYSGLCAAAQNTPDRDTQLHICNAGYARGRCPSFPASEVIDAVRFSAGAAPNSILWIEEADHSPIRFGEWRRSENTTVRDRQAKAFARSIEEGKVR